MPANSRSPSLIDAVQKGDVETVRAYLKEGMEADSSDAMSRSALYHAAYIGHVDIVKMLLERNADANFEDDDGETPFIASLENGQFEVAGLLLEAGADINMRSGRQRQSPLQWAFNMSLRDETTSRLLWLIGKGADYNDNDESGHSVVERARIARTKFPFAGKILEAINEFIVSRDPAVIHARQMEAAKEEMCEAIHGGLRGAISVRPIRLLPPPKPL